MTGVYVAIMAAALAAEPAKAPLADLGGVLAGRWIGDVTLIADWPGLGKRGEKVVAYVQVDWIADGNAFEIEWHGGAGSSKELFVWDAGQKKVRSMGASSGGRSWQTVWNKKGGQWRGHCTEHLADGTKVAGSTIVVAVENGGKKLIFTSEGEGFVGDKKLDPLRDVYTKLDTQEPANTPLQEYGELVVGRWMGDVTFVVDWPGIGKKGDKIIDHLTLKWTNDRRAIVSESHFAQGCSRSIHVWDPAEKKIRIFSTDSAGAFFSGVIDKSGDKWTWILSGCLADGTPQNGSGTIVFSNEGRKHVLVGDVVVGNEKASFIDSYTRLDD